jgi:hypothetical protein
MLPTNQIGHRYKSVIVNKPALQAWLLAWTTGKAFSVSTRSVISSREEKQPPLATLRRLQQTMAQQPER